MFGNKMLLLLVPWRFLISNKLEQLEFKLKEIIGIEKHAGKVGKCQNFRDTISGWLTAFACFAPKKVHGLKIEFVFTQFRNR